MGDCQVNSYIQNLWLMFMFIEMLGFIWLKIWGVVLKDWQKFFILLLRMLLILKFRVVFCFLFSFLLKLKFRLWNGWKQIFGYKLVFIICRVLFLMLQNRLVLIFLLWLLQVRLVLMMQGVCLAIWWVFFMVCFFCLNN